MHKKLSFDDENGIYPANNVEDDEVDKNKKAIPRSHLAEIIDEIEDNNDDFDDDLDQGITSEADEVDDD